MKNYTKTVILNITLNDFDKSAQLKYIEDGSDEVKVFIEGKEKYLPDEFKIRRIGRWTDAILVNDFEGLLHMGIIEHDFSDGKEII